MLSREDYLMICEQRARGAFIKDIATSLGVHPRTVSRALARGAQPPVRQSGVRPTKLDPFKAQVDALLTEGVWNASVILRHIQRAGYTGGSTQLRDYIQPKRALRPKGTVRFETPVAEQLQHDWGELRLRIGSQMQRVCLSVNVLGYSRAVFVQASLSMNAEHTYASILAAFDYFGGVTHTVLVDNQKAAVTEWRDGKPRFNRRFRELGKHCGFVPRAARPRRAQTKGKVERMVRYVKENALAGQPAFESIEALNVYLRHWCDTVANERVPRELGEAVNARWSQERAALHPLPHAPFDTAYHHIRQVSLDAFISLRGNRYSVPGHLVGETVQVREALDGTLSVSHAAQCVATHRLQENGGGQCVVIDAHHAPLWAAVRVGERDLSDYDSLAEVA